MKKIIQLFTLLAAILLAACGKEVYVNEAIPGAGEFTMVYMPQANAPLEKAVRITDSPYQFTYSAFIGGSLKNGADVKVKFDVLPAMVDSFNLKNATSYKILPAGSYVLNNPEAIISSGNQSTSALHISVKTLGYILPFETYLLPVSITEAGIKINNAISTTYFIITGSYSPGEVPREKVYSFGADAGTTLFDFNGKLIHKAPDGRLLLYPVANNGTFEAPSQIGSGWNIFNMVFYYGGNRLIGRDASGGGDITQYVIDANGNFGASKKIGFGWGIFSKIIPYKGALLGIDGGGSMTMYPLEAEDFNYGKIRQIGIGWSVFTQIVPYQNSLLTIDANGNLYQYPLSEDGNFGARKHVGSGWDMYPLVFASGTDLLALDSAGDLWRYKFNPAGFWPLKK
ncbi:DUF1735 domain-containing protein [Paraflavitalea soli]|uniref:DUF1735 domain-containing protein n=1 Tax=Paraflavitalea soli TaxID=2315862 RepID=A0A3B7MUP2_9BACT|nr:DUF1735 domain-containing protein [Paraflavitalea soli]AXY78254.1 DUF1735 domain-containing protein [Paraflavitalea soli]